MDPETYRLAGELFERLRTLPEGEAARELEEAAQGDEGLRSFVWRLLRTERSVENRSFLEGRAIEDAASLLVPSREVTPPAPGTVLGTYRLVRRIGAGGTGVVYDAQDLRLNRRVAVKILHQQLAGETDDRIVRFQQEAHATSRLNHPHIVSIYDAAFDGGQHFIAMEFVEGRTVRELLAEEPHGLEPRVILDWLSQASSALSAAHQAGIVHRDIKPENLMIRPDGFLKVLDFGLAKLREPSSGFDLRTRTGNLAGTIYYLSPEQAAGKRVDARTDLFSLGVVAYELATGRRPFDGPADGAIFDAILNHYPPTPSALRPSLDAGFDALVMQALEKDPELRFQTASDLRSACKRLTREPSQSALQAAPGLKRGGRRRTWAALSAVATLTLGVGLAYFWNSARLRHNSETAAPRSFERLTDTAGEDVWPSLSPDGKQFVYARVVDGRWSIFLQRTGGNTAVELTRAASSDDTQPALSPDGSRIVFRSERDGGGLFLMDATGENPRRLTRDGYSPAWSPDSRHVVYSPENFRVPALRATPKRFLYVVDVDGGAARPLATADAMQPSWSPHGKRVAYWGIDAGGRRDLFTIDPSGRQPPVPVTQDAALDWNPVWSPSGRHLYFLSDRGGPMNVWLVPIDENSGEPLGPPEPLTVPALHVGGLGMAANGTGFVYSQSSQRFVLGKAGFDFARRAITGPPEPLAGGSFPVVNFSFSADGAKLVFDTLGAEGPENLWVMNADGSGRRRLTDGNYRDRTPAWSPTNDDVVFFSNRTGPYEAWLVRSDGSGLRRLTALAKPAIQKSIWFPDGKQILASRTSGPPVTLDPARLTLATDPPVAPGLENAPLGLFNLWLGEFAVGDLGPLGGKEVMLYGGTPPRIERTGVAGQRSTWLPDSVDRSHRYFLVAREGDCILYDRTLRRETKLFSVAPNRIYDLGVPPDGRSIYFSEVIRDSDLWLARFGK